MLTSSPLQGGGSQEWEPGDTGRKQQGGALSQFSWQPHPAFICQGQSLLLCMSSLIPLNKQQTNQCPCNWVNCLALTCRSSTIGKKNRRRTALSISWKKYTNCHSPVWIFIGTAPTRNPDTMGMTGATLSGSFVKAFRDPIQQNITWCKGCTEIAKSEKMRKAIADHASHTASDERQLLISWRENLSIHSRKVRHHETYSGIIELSGRWVC